VKNYLISDKYKIQIDNIDPVMCEAVAYKPYSGAIRLYANVLDLDSGIYYVEYWIGPPGDPASSHLGSSFDASSAFQLVWATALCGRDDGSHIIYARAYDRAGNYLDSTGLEIIVDNSPSPALSTQDFLLITLMAMGAVGIGAYLLDILYLRKRANTRVVPTQKSPPLKGGTTIVEKPPKEA
jgi:hypothetical protein